MRYNQYSYISSVSEEQMLQEMQALGFSLSPQLSDRENLYHFLERALLNQSDLSFALSQWIADWKSDLAQFFQEDRPLTEEVFQQVALQLLGFIPHFDYTDLPAFVEKIAFPVHYEGQIIPALYHLLNTRTKRGNLLVEELVSDDLIPEDNQYHFFNGKSLATFNTKDVLREVVYVEAPVDTDQDGQLDLVKVSIIRPKYEGQVPVIMTQSPYHQGVNEVASDKALHKMETELAVKEPGHISVETRDIALLPTSQPGSKPVGPATEKTGHMGNYTLNDYLLARGFATIYVSGVGTYDSDGFMTSGDYQQVAGFKAVVDWLNGRAVAYSSHQRTQEVLASWANGKVATTGISYLGTMSNALATTGVKGLEVIIAEAGISSWYDYYRENGLVTSPGGYPGEDLDSLAGFTYSKALRAGDWLKHKDQFQTLLGQMTTDLQRENGDYNQFWHDRNYLPRAKHVTAEVVFTHGTQDWNVKPLNVYNMFHALPQGLKKHLFLHNGAHVYMNNWQSIDFRESMNALLSKRLLGYDNQFDLPTVIWQDNSQEQTWRNLVNFGGEERASYPLGEGTADIQNHYDNEHFDRYGKSYASFHQDLYAGKANQITIPLSITEDLLLNGRPHLSLRVKSSVAKGLLSAHLLEVGEKKRLTPLPTVQSREGLDNGRYHAMQPLTELPMTQTPHRLISKGYLNLQNRRDLYTIEAVTREEWMTIEWDLQPTIYQLHKEDTLSLILFTTDFEVTVRDNGNWTISVDLASSQLTLPTSQDD